MKKEFALFFVFLCIILPIKGQIVIDTSPIKPYDMGPALSVLNSYNNAFSRAMDQFSSYYDKAQEYYRDGNYTAAKTYLERCNQLNSRFRRKICDQESLNKSIKQVDEAIEYQEQKKKAVEKYNIGVDAYLKENYTVAVPNFIEAARFGIPEAQCILGFCYENGLGVTCSNQMAAEWYQKAASQGSEQARTALLNLQMRKQSIQGRKIK